MYFTAPLTMGAFAYLAAATPTGQVDCHGPSVDSSVLQNVQNSMANFCNGQNTIPSNNLQYYFGSDNSTIVYVCNLGSEDTTCDKGTLGASYSQIQAKCPLSSSGGSWYNGPAAVTYGYQVQGTDLSTAPTVCSKDIDSENPEKPDGPENDPGESEPTEGEEPEVDPE